MRSQSMPDTCSICGYLVRERHHHSPITAQERGAQYLLLAFRKTNARTIFVVYIITILSQLEFGNCKQEEIRMS
jgi:hypothetical protein